VTAWDDWTPDDVATELAPWPEETTMETSPKPSPGRIVLFAVGAQPRVAIVLGTYADAPMLVDLRVFAFNPATDRGVARVPYDADGKPGTWRWPPRVP
jgi:hypothetical protein